MNMRRLEYQEIDPQTQQQVLEVLSRNEKEELILVPIAVGLYEPDFDFAYSVLRRLWDHKEINVKANAVLGFGYLAMRFKKLPLEVKSIVEEALKHDDDFMYGQAWAAASDIAHFLGWEIDGHEE
jgi:hypothetical protein